MTLVRLGVSILRSNRKETNKQFGPIASQAHLLHDAHILLIVVVAVASNISTGPVNDVTRHLGENVPNARPFSILIPGTLNLVSCCGGTPEKVVREGVKEQRFFRAVSKSYGAQEEDNPDHPH